MTLTAYTICTYIFVMRYEWDEHKNQINRRKPGVSFELASKVFDDPLHLTKFDRTVDGEERWHALGNALGVVLLLVVHTYRLQDGDEVIRIISARKATSHERRQYEDE